MQKWEYRFITVYTGLALMASLTSCLNLEGQNGWEVVSIITHAHESNRVDIFFKRPLEQTGS